MNSRNIFFSSSVILLSLLLFPLAAEDYSMESRGWSACAVRIVDLAGRKHELKVWIADSDQKRQLGLMHVRHLRETEGMLFVFSRIDYLNFWMKDTLIPLSLAYIDSNGKIFQIVDMNPLDTSLTYPSKAPARYALEVSRGWFQKRGIKSGCRIELRGCIGK